MALLIFLGSYIIIGFIIAILISVMARFGVMESLVYDKFGEYEVSTFFFYVLFWMPILFVLAYEGFSRLLKRLFTKKK